VCSQALHQSLEWDRFNRWRDFFLLVLFLGVGFWLGGEVGFFSSLFPVMGLVAFFVTRRSFFFVHRSRQAQAPLWGTNFLLMEE
jgi:hypothetical protein